MRTIGKTLERLEVVIEGTAEKYKQMLNDTKKKTNNFIRAINEEMGKVKGPTLDVDNSDSVRAVKNMQSFIRKTVQDVKKGALPKGMTDGIKTYIKEAQLAAGIRVYTDDYLKLGDDIENTSAKLIKFLNEKNSMSDSDIYEESQEFKELSKCIADTEKKLTNLLSRQDKMEFMGVGHNNKAWKSIQFDIEETKNTLDAYKQDVINMQNDGSSVQHTQKWKDITDAIRQAEMQLDSYNSREAQMRLTGTDTRFNGPVKMRTGSAIQTAGVTGKQVLSDLNGKLQEVHSKITETIQKIPILGRVATESAYLASKAFGGLRSVFSKVTPAIKKAGGAFKSLLQRFVNGIPVLRRFTGSMRNAGQSGNRMGGIFRTIAMSARFMFASFAIRGAIDGAKQGLQNLAQYSGTTNQSLSMLMSSLTQLKNAFATAFAPILNVVAPILNTLINLISRAVTAIGMLFATLTGQSSFIRAKKVQQDYAASLGNSASGADKANAANQKLQRTLLGFDEVNKLDDDSDSGSSGGGGGAGGLSPWDMFEEVPIDNSISAFAQKLKEAWEKADFTEIGEIIGNKLNGALESIPWDKIKETSRRIASSLATFLNGFIGTTDWNLVGKTFAEGINTVTEFGYTFVTTFNWKQFGNAVAESINGAFANIDWAKAAQTLSGGIKGLLDTLLVAVQNTNWKQIGISIGTFINNIDWKNIIQTALMALLSLPKAIFDMITGAIKTVNWRQLARDIGTAVKNAVINFDWKGVFSSLGELIGSAIKAKLDIAKAIGEALADAVTSAKKYFQGKIEECGGNVVAGIFKGIKDAILGIGTWIKENVFQPFIDGFKNVFGIHSPSTVMEEQGSFIIDGLLKGLMDNIGKIIDWFKELPDKIKGALGDAKDWLFGEGGQVKKAAGNAWSWVLEKGSAAKDWVLKKGGAAVNWAAENGNDIANGVSNGLNAVGNVSKSVADWIQEKVGKVNIPIGAETTDAKKDVDLFSSNVGKNTIRTALGFSTTQKQLQKNVDKTAKGTAVKTEVKPITESNMFRMGMQKLTEGFSLDVKATAEINNIKDKVSLRQRTLTGYTARLDAMNDSIKNKLLTSWTARLDGKNDNINNKLLTAFTARVDSKNDNIKDRWFGAMGATFTGKGDSIGDRWFGGMGAIFTALSNGLKNPWLGNIGAVITALTKATGLSLQLRATVVSAGVGALIATFRKDGGIFANGSWRSVTAYAGGGTPNMGQMFIAREAGPELVGTIGGHTAVMNNDQIVSSVAAGVYQAVLSAMATAGQSGNNTPSTINVYIGGKRVTDVVVEEINNRTAATGTCPIMI